MLIRTGYGTDKWGATPVDYEDQHSPGRLHLWWTTQDDIDATNPYTLTIWEMHVAI